MAAFNFLPSLLWSVSVGRFGNEYALQGESFYFPFAWVQISDFPSNSSMTPKANTFHLLGSLCWSAQWGVTVISMSLGRVPSLKMLQTVWISFLSCLENRGGCWEKKWKISFCSLLCPPFLLEFSPVWLAISGICSACPPTYLETIFSTFHMHNKFYCPRSFCLVSLSLIPILLPFLFTK